MERNTCKVLINNLQIKFIVKYNIRAKAGSKINTIFL